MGHSRNIVCYYYINEGNCELGKQGTFRNKCQKCESYKPTPGRVPVKDDHRKEKLEKIRVKEELEDFN